MALFGQLGAVKRRIAELGFGTTINTSHLEQLNGIMRSQQASLSRRPRCVSLGGRWLKWSLCLRRNLYNWVRVHRSLAGQTPAMAMGLSERASLVGATISPASRPYR
jgi:hypothetical protein